MQRRGQVGKQVSLVCLAVAGAVTSLGACSASGDARPSAATTSPATITASIRYPNAIVVMGHSGTTGYNSDPSSPDTDAKQNSWATGDNPTVNSIYTRLLALNPAVRGHSTNLGVDGSNMDQLVNQVDKALALKPVPDLFMIQEIDNDMQCDGTDPDNYPRFGQTISDLLTKITAKAPKATILLVGGPPGTVQNYGEILSHLPGPKAANTGTGPCDLFSPAGQVVPAHWRYAEKVIRGYQTQLATVCQKFPTCRYDGAALYRMVMTAADVTPDGNHITVSGHRKQAEVEWQALGFGS
jgi:hypothetical protein